LQAFQQLLFGPDAEGFKMAQCSAPATAATAGATSTPDEMHDMLPLQRSVTLRDGLPDISGIHMPSAAAAATACSVPGALTLSEGLPDIQGTTIAIALLVQQAKSSLIN
jgi:hypothetical protein